MEGDEIKPLIEGAEYLFTNEYEAALIEQKTGWSPADLASMVQVRVITMGPDGARIERRGAEPVQVSVPEEERKADPTGCWRCLPRRLPGRSSLGTHRRTLSTGWLAGCDLRHRDGRHPGVRTRPTAFPGTASSGVRR